MKHFGKLSSFCILLAWLHPAWAENSVANTQDNTSQTQNTLITNTMPGDAKTWGLTAEEWTHYQQLMKGKDGHWYPQLTPPEVLGLNADTSEEQQHFADIVAQEEHDKLARELAFDRAVHEALLKRYPNEPVIKPFDLSPYNPIQVKETVDTPPLQAGDHLVLFEDIQQAEISRFIPKLLDVLKRHPDVVLDIYCVNPPNKVSNKNNDAAIQAFAKRNQLPVDLVNHGHITLNYDNGKFQKIAKGSSLPYLLLVHNDNARPVSLDDLG